MPDSASLQQLFPALDQIPAEFRPSAPIHQRVSLVDGELRPWDGATKTVLSPVCARQPDGTASSRSRSAVIR